MKIADDSAYMQSEIDKMLDYYYKVLYSSNVRRQYIVKRYINSTSKKNLQKYIFKFGDGNSARSRGYESEEDITVEAMLSCDVVAMIAAAYMTSIYIYHDEYLLTDEIVFNVLSEDYGWEEEDWNKAISENNIEEWKNTLSSADISGGDVLMYKVFRKGKILYYDKDLEREVKSLE